jgi:ABC-2 type transport system permease protein
MSETRAAGAIYDLGYQHYDGARLGRLYAFRTLLVYSFRTAFGLGRGDKAKSLPIIIVALVYLPAMIQIAIASAAGMVAMIHYADHLEFTAFLLALFSAGLAPELVVADRQQGVLTLYLSRPIRGIDYALAKLLAMTGAMLVLTLGPQLTLFLGVVFVSATPWAQFQSEWTKLFPIVGGTVIVSLFFASVSLALSSFASRRGYGSAAVIAFFLLTAGFSEIVRSVGFGGIERYAILGNPALLISGFAKWLFEVEARRRSAVGRAALPGTAYLYVLLVSIGIATTLLLNRYRKGDT